MRSIGRRKTDKYQWAAGMMLGAVLVTYAFYVGACGGGTTVSGPEPVAKPVSEPIAAPAPAPTATPSLVGDDPTKAFELTCSAGANLSVKYNGPASNAEVETWWTTFDNQDPNPRPGLQKHVVKIGDSVNRTFAACQQGDAAQPGVKEIGGCFFDKDMKPFVPSRNPEKVVECRNVCVGEWLEIENDPEITYGEYGLCTLPQVEDDSLTEATTTQCSKKRTVTITYTEQNTCTKATRKGRVVVREESTPCECPCTYSQASYSGTVFSEEDRQPGFFTDWWVKTSAHVQGAAVWKLEIYAASSTSEYNGNDPDYTKASTTVTLDCKSARDLSLEYHSDDHSSDVWWAALYKDGVRVWKSQAEYN